MAKEPVKICCKSCGSEAVKRDAWAQWDYAAQEWVLENVFDDGYCDDCDGEATLIEVPVQA